MENPREYNSLLVVLSCLETLAKLAAPPSVVVPNAPIAILFCLINDPNSAMVIPASEEAAANLLILPPNVAPDCDTA